MRTRSTVCATTLGLLAVLQIGGCAGFDFDWSGSGLTIGLRTGITVELVNDTAFHVDPRIRIDEDDGDFDAFLAGVFGSDPFSTGLLEPGEIIELTFDCDELGLVLSDEAEQIERFTLFDEMIGYADQSDVLQRDEDFECGDWIRFRFVGDFGNFGVIVSVNGSIVD
ncbi:MAG: hypothetical protein KKB50_03475 [Planctomycetes bacterium]|nr:hypothetical protein [Planctomycetota bacterium]